MLGKSFVFPYEFAYLAVLFSTDIGHMRKFYFLSTLVLLLLHCISANAQDFSNKGKDFWVAYGYHQVMNAGNSQDMLLYFATDQVTTVTVSIPGLGYSVTYPNIPANTVFTSATIPKAGGQDARLTSETASPVDKGIHITSDKPIVAYAHIYNSNVSGATILYPTNTLGKEYYSVNFTNLSNTTNANCWFYVIAADTGTTTVEITPSANTLFHTAGIPFQVNLTQGQVYNLMGTTSGNIGVDLTGSTIKSVSNNGQCKKIAVFSGSGRIAISCNGSAPSSDNYMVQAMPKTAWGKKFLTVPSANYGASNGNGFPLTPNIFRVCVASPSTNVYLNGAPIGLPLQNNFYYEIAATDQPLQITADKAIMVAQYFPSQSVCGAASGDGDPETIYLSPIEQSISRVQWSATHSFQINPYKHWINVVIPNSGTAITSFKLDGVNINPSAFIIHPQNPFYSYAVLNVTGSSGSNTPHVVESDSGFNAIAYGYGPFESYGYNAGTNIRDLYNQIGFITPWGESRVPATCKDVPVRFRISIPYQPDSLYWDFHGFQSPNVWVNSPPYPQIPDSVTIVNNRAVYWYSLPGTYSYNTVGSFPVTITAYTPNADCGSQSDLDFNVDVYDLPIANFNFSSTGCATSTVTFTDSTITNGRNITRWFWGFGDGNTAYTQNTTHTYGVAGSYNVQHSVINDIGCRSDTLTKVVTLSNPPVANFTASTPACPNTPIQFTDASTASGGGTITAWSWAFGDGGISTLQNPTHTYSSPGTYTVTLIVTASGGCQSNPYLLPVIIHPAPVANFILPSICLPGTGQFTDQSTISGVGESITGWSWDFGDGGTSTQQNPTHTFIGLGPYTITLIVTSNNGCSDTKVLTLTSTGVEPQAAFTVSPTACNGSTVQFTDNSSAPGSTIVAWNWNFGDPASGANNTSTLQNPTHVFSGPGTYTVTLNVTSAAGCTTVNNFAQHTVTVNALPTPSISGPISACLNVPGNVYTTQAGNTNYIWTVVGGTITAGGNSTSNTATVTWTSTGAQSISVNYTDPNGCTAATATVFNVTVNTLPIATITPGGPITFCVGGSVTLTASAGTSWLWSTGATTQSITVNTSGSYTVTVSNGNGCSATSAPITVTVNALPAPSISGPNSVCFNSVGNVYTTQPGNTNYIWTVVGGTITAGGNSTSNTATITWTSTGTQSISVNYTNANGCTAASAAVYNVTVNALPTPAISGPTSACLNVAGNVYSTQPGNTNYVWTVIGGTITAGGNSTSNSATVTWTSTGVQSISVNYTDVNGCTSATATVFNVTVNPLPAPTINGPISICLNSTGNVYTTEAGKTNYVWTVVGGIITAGGNSTSNTATVTWTNTGSQSISVNYTDANGCTAASATVFNVTVNPLPTPTISGSTSVCLNSTGNVYSTETGKTNYIWTVVGGTITAGGNSTSNTTTVTWTTAGAQSISVNYTDANGCTASSATVFNVTVKPLPTATISGTTEVCLNGTPPLITFTGANGTAPYTFVYTINGGSNQTITTSSGNSVTVPVPTGTAGAYTYTLVSVTEGSSNACSQNQTGSATVTVDPLPTADFNTSLPSCATNNITFTDASIANTGNIVRWYWDYGDGSNAVLTSPAPFNHVYATAGTYTVTLKVETDKGCQSTVLSKQIVVHVRPRADFTAPQICISDPVAPFTDASTISSGTVTGWYWKFDDGGTSTLQNPSHPFITAGNHSATLIITSDQGCTDTITHTFFVNGTPTSSFTVQNVNTLCSNQTVNITDGSSVTAGSIIRTEIYWDYNNDPTIKTVDNSPVNGKIYNHIYPEFGSPASRSVTIRYVTYSGITCLSSVSQTITLLATPTLQFSAVNPVCSNAPAFQITEAQLLNGIPGSGVFSGTGVSPTGLFDPASSGAGAFVIRYTYNATNGCSNYVEQTVNIYPTPGVDAGPDKVVLEGGVVKLTPSMNISGIPVTYLWTPSTGLVDPTNPYTNTSPPYDITYTLTVTSDHGCTASDSVTVKVLKTPVIPNIFSPNGDGVHDRWEIPYLSTYPGCTVDVYNRYGQLIFHSTGYNEPWDGTVNGKPVPVGTYYYIVDPKNGRKIMAGYVDVIR